MFQKVIFIPAYHRNKMISRLMQLQFGDWMVLVVSGVDFCPVGQAIIAS
jgi:hypothetical protein